MADDDEPAMAAAAPSWFMVPAALLLEALIAIPLGYPLRIDMLRPDLAPAHAAAALLVYALAAIVPAGGDPRIWRRPAPFTRWLGDAGIAGDAALVERLRRAAWRQGSRRMAWQSAAVAATAAGAVLLRTDLLLAIAGYLAGGIIAGAAAWLLLDGGGWKRIGAAPVAA